MTFAASSAPLARDPAVIHGSIQLDLPSRITGRTYRVFVFQPDAAPPPSGYPVVLTTDGNLTFPLAATMGAAFALRGGKAALVVGVGYPTDDPMQLIALRAHDLTPATQASGADPGVGPEDAGGCEGFYRFLVEELRPMIAGAYSVDADDQTLYGHSWGGLFALHVLFNHPASFQLFAASSPSIWWDGRSILADEPDFARRVEAGEVAPRVLISVGSREQDAPPTPLPGRTHAQMQDMMREARMVDNARELSERLQGLDGQTGYQVRFHSFHDEDHLTALPASIGRTLAFALRT